MNVPVSLTPELVDLIKAKVASGRYTSTSGVVREALRLVERADRREAEELRRLRDAWKEGAASGDAGPLPFKGLKAEAQGRQSGRAKGWRGLARPPDRPRPRRSARHLARRGRPRSGGGRSPV